MMAEHGTLNAALARVQKLEELLRVQRKLENRVDVLGDSDALALLRKVEALL